MNTEIKQIKLILRNTTVELEGTPESLIEKIEYLKLLDALFAGKEDDRPLDYGTVVESDSGNVIQFPSRGIYAHPSYLEWKGENRG